MDRQIKILALIIIMPYTLWAQKETISSTSELSKDKIGVSFSTLGDWDLVSKVRRSLIGGPSDNDVRGNFYSIGGFYIHPIAKRLDLEIGLEYSRFNYSKVSDFNFYCTSYLYNSNGITIGGCHPIPLTTNHHISLIEIPIQARFNFLKYLFINGGLVVDIDTSKDNTVNNQGGLGYILGVGAKYECKAGWGVFVNPYVKNRAILSASTNSDSRKHIMDSGFRFGITYNLK